MSVAGGRPLGGDGYDFAHRQKVASHYRESITYKARLKSVFIVHGLLAVLIFVKLFDDIIRFQLGFELGWFVSLNLPDAVFWEYWWFTSLVTIILASNALPKNKERELTYAYYAMFILGVVPISIGIGAELPNLLGYIADPEDEDHHLFMGHFPMVVIWFMWFFVVCQVHILEMFFSYRLVTLWRPLTKQEKILLEKKDT